MSAAAFAGIYPAFPTPTTDAGLVDEHALRALLRFLLASGVSGLVPVGGTGEFTALSPKARMRAVEITVEESAGRVPVIAGVLSPGYAEAVEMGNAFRQAGVQALLVLAPFYVRPTQEAIRSYFSAYRNDVDLPVLFYDIPGKTAVVTASSTVIEMARDGSIVGMKACNTDMHHFNQIMTSVAPGFSALSGEDTLFPFHMAMGACGGILATATIMPHYWLRMLAAANAGDIRKAVEMQQVLVPFLDAVFSETNPGPLKDALSILGLPSGKALRPLSEPSARTRERLVTEIAALRARGVIQPLGSIERLVS
jgi:4-hydroxy-tetrahydrodipicolinate synthase